MGFSKGQIKEIADIIYKVAHPNETYRSNVRSMVELLQNLGIEVYKSEMKKDSISGYVTQSPNNSFPRVVVNSDDSLSRQRFTMAHELGHLIMHFRWKPTQELDPGTGAHIAYRRTLENYSENQRIEEQEANKFAAELLMPEDDFIKEFRTKDEEELAAHFGVSKAAVEIRIKTLKNRIGYY